ncbi:MAG TPA: amino acid adenylation domain-containing protein, partial [Solirubrobacteraceae bacterium]|nr:amino acid adenylation domain-containing protein [Solirubrobacteraceae bacterium]
VQLAAAVRRTLGRELPLQQLFAHPVLADLAPTLKEAAPVSVALIPPADRSGVLPLSFAQQRLWFLAQLDPAASRAYHMPAALRLRGQLRRDALQQALDQLVSRHEGLRTRFVSVDGEPCQVIAAADAGFVLTCQDLRALDESERQRQVPELVNRYVQMPFDLSEGPLIRGQLLQLGDEEHLLVVTQHHIISDGWSIGVLLRELGMLYAAAPLPPLPIQYADYAAWQRSDPQVEAFAAHRAFWLEELQGAPALLDLPTDRPRPAVQSYVGSQVPVHLDAALLADLKALGQREGTTLFMTLLAGWAIVLARLSGHDDIVVGTPVANRPRQELEGVIGFFVNSLALRVRLGSTASVAELLAHVRERALAAFSHAELPFEQVVEVLQPERRMSHSPVFQVMLALDNTPAQELALEGLALSLMEHAHATTHFDLTLSLTETEAGLVGALEYASDLFEAATVQRIAGYLGRVLGAMTQDATRAIATLPMLGAAERQQVLVEFNATQAEYPHEALIHELFEAQVERSPEATALVFEDRALSYGELNRRANQLAHHLIGLGVKPDDRVAIAAERSLELVVGLLAILKAGGAYVPLDPAYPADRLRIMLDDAEPVVVLTQSALEHRFVTERPTLLLDRADPAFAQQSELNPDARARGLNASHLAYVIYTSGSTGVPKGVMNTHQGLCNRLVWMQAAYGLAPADGVLQKTPFSFDVSVWEFFWTLLYGARLVIAKPEGHKDADYLSDLIDAEGVTTVHFVPSMLQHFVPTDGSARRCPSLRRVFCSGEALPYELQQRFLDHFDAGLHNLYGPTEAAIDVTYWACRRGDERHIVPIGRPIANTQIYILDAHGEPAPLGVAGEIHIGGAGVARGYLNRPELTAKRFLRNPFVSDAGARMYRTGDLGRWLPDGSIEYLGRNDFQVKIRGFRIELGEIEARLAACAGVREAVVLAREDQPGDKRLVAYVVPNAGQALEPASLRTQLAQGLAEYMIPSAFVSLETFPLTP